LSEAPVKWLSDFTGQAGGKLTENFNSLRNRLFYTVKPYIPRPLQIALRRRIAQHKRPKYSHIWPIDPNSASPLTGWIGWPDDKKFVLVLIHDVDNQKGQDRVLELANLEARLGFHSAFNFVPERYTNHEEIKQYLRTNGFEINAHGLVHDGNLFKNKKIFEQRAVKINRHLREWASTGFTSPSMHHNLSWLHALNITHSISTFDTDPFEPQPDALGTIFPLWMTNGRNSAGYVELPYTMPQDHLLFILLQEKTIDIWKRKLDWLVEKGGMVLLNTHSDYMNFGDHRLRYEEYPVGYYSEFLEHVKDVYAGQYWNALPADVARFWKKDQIR
jgi:hypothetical protein